MVIRRGDECVPDGAAGVDHYVDEDHRLAAHLGFQVGALHDGRVGQAGEVVTVVGDVEGADRDRCALVLLDEPGQASGDRDAAAADPHQHQVVDPAVALHDLVGDPGHRATQVIGVEDAAFG